MQLLFIIFFCIVLLLLASGGQAQYRVVCTGDCACSPLKENSTCSPSSFSAPDCLPSQVSCQFFAYHQDSFFTWFHVYNAVGLFWILFFLSAFEEMVLAGAFASWYWAFNKPADIPANPLLKSMHRTLRCHLGTLAFGSLIIAIVRMIRVGFEYIDYKLKQYSDNKVVKALMCCCKCCLWCLESFLKFVNRNAYVYCAIYGTNFCFSARNSFSLITRNIVRVVVLDKVTDFLMLIGELVVTGIMAILSFYIFSGEIPYLRENLPHMNYYMTPVIIITVAAFFIASSFFDVYNMAVDTLFLCFLEDCERNDGSEAQPYFMSKELMELLKNPEEGKEES